MKFNLYSCFSGHMHVTPTNSKVSQLQRDINNAAVNLSKLLISIPQANPETLRIRNLSMK